MNISLYYTLLIIAACSILVPAFTTLFKAKRITTVFYPLILLIWVWVLTDLFCLYFMKYDKVHIINGIHFFFESQIVLYQFYKWRTLNHIAYKVLAILFATFW